MLSKTLQHSVSFVSTDKYQIAHHSKIETTEVQRRHCCFKNIFISVLPLCWVEARMFLSFSRSSRPWNSSRNSQRRSAVWSSSSSSRTSRRRSRRGIGESSMFPVWASGAKIAPEKVRARHRHHHHYHQGWNLWFWGPQAKARMGPPDHNSNPFQSFFNTLP